MAPAPRRLVVCTDAKNEAVDQFAVVHALLTETLDVRGIVPSHFGRPGSMAASRDEVRLLLGVLGAEVVVADGAPDALPNSQTPSPSPGSQLIAAEAAAPGRLFVAVLGPNSSWPSTQPSGMARSTSAHSVTDRQSAP